MHAATARHAAAALLGLAGLLAGALPGAAAAASAADSAVATAGADAPELPSGWTPRSLARGPRDMVAAAHPLAVQAGVATLARGGSAVDAAIAAQWVLAVVEPQSSGLGGGGFLLHFDPASGAVASYDGRETAPATAQAAQFRDATGRPLGWPAAVDGGHAVGVPGLVRMLELAHGRHGRLPWASLFDDAIRLAETGAPVSARLHGQTRAARERILAQGEPVATVLLGPDRQAWPVGTMLRQPALAATLRRVAADGADALHSGEIARAIVERVAAHPERPGRLSLADLAGYQARPRAPVCGAYRGHRICGMGPPSSGGLAVLQTLGMLEFFDLRAMGPGSLDAVHLVSEALRLAYADRLRHVADPDVVPVPVAGLLDAAYLRARASLIRPDRSLGLPAPGQPAGSLRLASDASVSLPSTTHLSVVDAQGRAVALTSSIENGLGSLQMAAGMLLNNQLTDFSFAPAGVDGLPVANALAGGKRPRSAMAPTLVFGPDGRLRAVIGSPGGPAIIGYVVKTLIGLIDWDLDIQQAIDLPNVGAQASATTVLERGTPLVRLADGLRARGHTVLVTDLNSGLHGIVADPVGGWTGGADPRRDGAARGTP